MILLNLSIYPPLLRDARHHGTYRVDIYLNDEFMTSRDITFIADDNNAELIPCLSTDLLVSLGIKISVIRQ